MIDEELALLKDYAKTDAEGNFVIKESGNFDIQDAEGFNEQMKELYDEYFVIDDANLQSALKTVEKIVHEFDKELVGASAEAHFYLVEAFENAGEEDSKNEN